MYTATRNGKTYARIDETGKAIECDDCRWKGDCKKTQRDCAYKLTLVENGVPRHEKTLNY